MRTFSQMSIGIKDVARLAGVSAATVSRVLGDGPVSTALRERVERALDATGYRPNLSARRLRSRHADTIGLIVSDLANPFFTGVGRAVEDMAARAGFAVVLCNTDEDPDREAAGFRLMQEDRVRGLIVAPTRRVADRIDRLAFDFPVVLIDRARPGTLCDCVAIDDRRAAGDLVDHLIAHGHRRIVGLFGDTGAATGDRCDGYCAKMAAYGLVPEVWRVAATATAAAAALDDLMRRREPPEAVIAANGRLLLGCARALNAAGLETPRDLALAGFDNEVWTDLVDDGLSVIEQPVAEIGHAAMRLLLERLAAPEAPPRRVVLASRLLERGSTARRDGDRPGG